MPKFEYNPNNTEGAYPESIDFIDTEIKKGDKIVATDLVDLYDTYPESQTPDQGDALVYDSADGIWKPGEGAGGSSCNIFEGYDESNNGYTINSIFINENTTTPGNGQYDTPFQSLKECFLFLNNCKTIPDEIELTIHLLSDLTITEETSLNHPQGYNIIIDGNGHKITNEYDVVFKYGLFPFRANAVKMNGRYSTALVNNKIMITGDNLFINPGYPSTYKTYIFTRFSNTNEYNVSQIFGGNGNTSIISDTKLYSKGYNNDNGQLGLGTDTEKITSYSYVDIDDVKTVVHDQNHSNILKNDGTLWVSTNNEISTGSYGIRTGTLDIYSKTPLLSMWMGDCNPDFVKVAFGENQTIALSSDGSVWVSGSNGDGQTGLGESFNGYDHYTKVTSLGIGYSGVFCYSNDSFLIKNGQVYGTGRNDTGQLGLGDKITRYEFTPIPELSNVDDSIEMSNYFLKNDGTIWSLSTDGISFKYAQIKFDPIAFPDENDDQWIDVTRDFALKNDGTSWFFKKDHTISNSNNYIFEKINDTLNIIKLSSGGIFLSDDGTIWESKRNNHSPYNTYLVQIESDDDWVELFYGGQYRGMALKSDGTMWALTYNSTHGYESELTSISGNMFDDYHYIFAYSYNTTRMVVLSNGWIYTSDILNGGQYGGIFSDFTDAMEYVNLCYYDDIRYIDFNMFIKNDGTMWGNGNSKYFGQYTIGVNWDSNLYNKIGDDNDWKMCKHGKGSNTSKDYCFFAIKENGTLWCGGCNAYGQLGVGNNIDSIDTIIQVGDDNDWIDVSTSGTHTIALRSNGTLWVTGRNVHGELGLGDNVDRNIFTQVGTDTDWRYIETLYSIQSSMAIKTDGTIWFTGKDTNQRLNYYSHGGLGESTKIYYYEFTNLNMNVKKIQDDSLSTKLSISDNHSIKEMKNIQLESKLISDDFADYTEGELKFKLVRNNYKYSVAVDENNTMWMCGDVGYPYTGSNLVYHEVGSRVKNDAIVSEPYSVMYIDEYGLTGMGHIENVIKYEPMRHDLDWFDIGFSEISTGSGFYLCIKNNGTLWASHRNNNGQLGLGHRNVVGELEQVGTDSDWKQVSCGYNHTLVMKNNGEIWSCGNNSYGQLGYPSGTPTGWNIWYTGVSDAISIFAGGNISFYIRTDGSLFFCGRNLGGAGNGNQINTDNFTLVSGVSGCVEIAGYEFMTMLLCDDGTVYHSEESTNNVFVQYTEIKCKAINTNTSVSHSSRIIDSTGAIYGIGGNDNGELGVGDRTYRYDFTYAIGGDYINNVPVNDVLYVDSQYYEYIDFIVGNESCLNIISANSIIGNSRYISEDYDGNFIALEIKNTVFETNNKSLLYSYNSNIHKIQFDNSTYFIDDVLNSTEINLWNDSTLVINQIPSVYPTVDNYESTYIINGVKQ